MDALKRMLFLELCSKELGNKLLPDYFITYESLTQAQKERFQQLSQEVQNLCNYLNRHGEAEADTKERTIETYQSDVASLSEDLLSLIQSGGFTFTGAISPRFRKSYKQFTGQRLEAR